MSETLRILCVHQGSELYGSDKVFAQSVKALRQRYPHSSLTVHLPQGGALKAEMDNQVDRWIIGDLFVLRLSRLHPRHWRHLPALLHSMKKAARYMQEHDVVYVNTITPFGYLLLTRFSGKKIILHIHEYADGLVGFGLRLLAKWSGCKIIANSQATAKAYDNVVANIVWNGVPEKAVTKTDLPATPLKLLLIGRINGWKGHTLAIEAMDKLQRDGFKDITLDIVGDVFDDQDRYRQQAVQKANDLKLNDRVMFHGFVPDPSAFFGNAHVVLVPSTRPEPFGLVAVEAMRHALPVIAADHGGLREIVVPNETGLLVQPNHADALAEGIRKYIVHPSLLNKHGNSGRARYDALFTEEHYLKRFVQAVERCTT